MSDLNQVWSESFAKHAQTSFFIAITNEFINLLLEAASVSEFVLRAQNGLFNKSNPEVVDILSNIQRYLTQMDQTAFVEVLQQSRSTTELLLPTNRNRTRGYKCESIVQVCQLLSSYLIQKRRASTSASAGAQQLTESENESSLNLILRPWLDIDSGCEFRIFIIGVHIHAIFQRKGGPAQSNQMAKKVFRLMLMSFLRTAQLDEAHLSEYMMDAFIAPDRQVWVLDIKSLKEAKKPTPGGWSELSLASRVGTSGSGGSSGGSSTLTSTTNSANNSTNNSTTTSPMVSPHTPQPPVVTLPDNINSMSVVYSNKSFEQHRLECVSSDTNNVMRGVAVHGSASSVGTSNPGTPVATVRKSMHTNSNMKNNSGVDNTLPTPPHTNSTSASSVYVTAPTSPEHTHPTSSSNSNGGSNSGSSNNSGSGSSMSDRKGITLHVEVPSTPTHHHINNLATPQTPYTTPFSPTTPITTPIPLTPIHITTLTPTSTPTTLNTDILSPVNVTLNEDDTHTIPPYLMEQYKLGPVLGKGAYANVREGTDKETGKQVAVKILHRGSVKTTAEVSVRREVHILSMLSHPNIVRTYAFYEEPEYFYTVLECIHGGALFDRIKLRKVFTEREVRELAVVLLGAVKHCHDHHVVHRDLKPENLLMTSADCNQDLKIVDFGFAAIDTGGCVLTDRCGTPMYVAPEILQKIPHGKPVDMWSCGVLLFLLLSGDAPFKDPNIKALYPKIKNGLYHFKSSWTQISPQAADLVKRLLVVPQLERLTVDQALSHPWFQVNTEELPTQHLSTVVEGLRSFQAAQRFRKGVNAVKALNRMKVRHQLTRTEYIDAVSKFPKEVDARYTLGDVLGRGGYATVYGAISKVDQRPVAIKIIPRAGLKAATELGIRRETEILRHLHHKNIVKSYDFIETEENFNVVLERVDGGELFDRIIKKKFYNEAEARDLAVVILKAVKHCHDHKVAHRDLKPENLLMTGAESADLKLVDFGFAAKCEGFSLTNQCGTPAYVAPEIIRKHPHGLPVDMWSFGVILYILLCGYPPFRDKVEKQLFLKIRAGVYEFHPRYWDKVSEEAQDLIRKLLVIDPVNRLTVEQALSHPWIHLDGKALSSYDLSGSLSEMELFQSGKQFKVGVNVILAIHKMSKSRLMRSSSMSASNSEVNTPVGSPMPPVGGVGSVGGVFVGGGSGPVSPKAGAGVTSTFTSNKRMANLLFSAAAKAASSASTSTAGSASASSTIDTTVTPTKPATTPTTSNTTTPLTPTHTATTPTTTTTPTTATPGVQSPVPSPSKAKALRQGYFIDTNIDSNGNVNSTVSGTAGASSNGSNINTSSGSTTVANTDNTHTHTNNNTDTSVHTTNTTGAGIAIDTALSNDSVALSVSLDNIYDISPVNSPKYTTNGTVHGFNNTNNSNKPTHTNTSTTSTNNTVTNSQHIPPFSPNPHTTHNANTTYTTHNTTARNTTTRSTHIPQHNSGHLSSSGSSSSISTAASPRNTQLVALMQSLHMENTSIDF